jgi:hypothetical protein
VHGEQPKQDAQYTQDVVTAQGEQFRRARSATCARAAPAATTRYQTLPAADWVESRPPLAQSASVPAAADLALGAVQTTSLLTIVDDARPLMPVFGPPAVLQRTIGGVRDAARIELGAPGGLAPIAQPIRMRLDVIVFNRAPRASAWTDLMAHELDARDPYSGTAQLRVAGPGDQDGVWLTAPSESDNVASVLGRRDSVGFLLQVTCFAASNASPATQLDLRARAESIARQAAADWSAWLEQQLAVA